MAPYLKKSPPLSISPLGDHHLGGHVTLLLQTHDSGPDNLVTASAWRDPQRINNNLN